VSLLPAINIRRCNGIDENPGQVLIPCDNETGNNLSPVETTPVIIYFVDTGEHKVVNISVNFHNNSKWPQRNTQGPGENLFMKKT
jgi:hypothetical protein